MPTVIFSHNKGRSLIFSRETKCLKPSQLAHPWHPLPTYEKELFTDQTLSKSIVGVLQYLSLTRPDIAFVVNKLYQHGQANSLTLAIREMLFA